MTFVKTGPFILRDRQPDYILEITFLFGGRGGKGTQAQSCSRVYGICYVPEHWWVVFSKTECFICCHFRKEYSTSLWMLKLFEGVEAISIAAWGKPPSSLPWRNDYLHVVYLTSIQSCGENGNKVSFLLPTFLGEFSSKTQIINNIFELNTHVYIVWKYLKEQMDWSNYMTSCRYPEIHHTMMSMMKNETLYLTTQWRIF